MRAGLLSILLVGCGATPPLPGDKPAQPADNDSRFTVHGRTWNLIGNPATPGDDTLALSVEAPSGTSVVDAWVGDLPPVRLAKSGGTFAADVAIGELPAGTYDLLLSANGASTAFARLPLVRTAPYYVLVSTDWDFSDPGQQVITYQNQMHAGHADLRITHFVGPYTFTDPAVTAERQAALVAWLGEQRDMHRDEIGLHIHPYCNFVTHAGVTCVTDQSTVYATDPTGYTIKLAAYDRPTMGILLAHAADLFAQHGLPRPRTFRAGGWTATLDTLNALAAQGFTADTSALNWARLEEWQGKELYRWNMEHWNPIGDTSQPYRPNTTNIVSGDAPTLPLLEVPDNGVMIDYVSLSEMTGLFDANWDGQPLATPVTLMMGFHPSVSFSPDEYQRVDGFLRYADGHLASQDLGPVVYITLSDVTPAFSP